MISVKNRNYVLMSF